MFKAFQMPLVKKLLSIWAAGYGALFITIVSAQMVKADQLTIFAAASLKEVVDDLGATFATETGHDLAISYAGTSQLARQIAAGAPADLFLSANPNWMDELEAKNLILPASRADFAANRLVLISAPETAAITDPDTMSAQLADRHIATGFVDAVPVGIYAKAALETLGIWDGVKAHVVQTDSVRAALALVSLGELPYGIVYATDAHAAPDVSVIYTFPEDTHPPIRYAAAAIKGQNEVAAQAFLDQLASDAGRKVLEKHGFIPLNSVK